LPKNSNYPYRSFCPGESSEKGDYDKNEVSRIGFLPRYGSPGELVFMNWKYSLGNKSVKN